MEEHYFTFETFVYLCKIHPLQSCVATGVTKSEENVQFFALHLCAIADLGELEFSCWESLREVFVRARFVLLSRPSNLSFLVKALQK